MYLGFLNLVFLKQLGLESAVDAYKAITRVFVFVLSAVLIAQCHRRKDKVGVFHVKILFAILLFAFCSILWSTDRMLSMLLLLEHSMLIATGYAYCLVNYSNSDEKSFFRPLVNANISLIVAVWLVFLILPDAAFRTLGSTGVKVFGGEVLHSHTLAYSSLFVILYYLAIGLKRKDIYGWSVTMLSFFTIFLAQSRSTMLAFVVIFVFTNYLKSKVKIFTVLKILLIAVLLACIFIYMNRAVVDYVLRGGSSAGLYTLGARTIIWLEIIDDVIQNRLVYGYGYQMLSEHGSDFVMRFGVVRGHAHNTFVQSFAGLGLFGFLIVCIQFMSTYYYVRKIDYLVITFSLLLVCVFSSLVEFGMFGPTSPVSVNYPIVVFYCVLAFRRTLHKRYV